MNPDVIVCQKDLGPQTAIIASVMKGFNPDVSWAKAEVVVDGGVAGVRRGRLG